MGTYCGEESSMSEQDDPAADKPGHNNEPDRQNNISVNVDIKYT